MKDAGGILNAEGAADYLAGGEALSVRTLVLDMGGWGLRLRSNSDELLNRLERYFNHAVRPDADIAAEVHAFERKEADLDVDYADWRREDGKTGRKDAYADIEGGRLIQKVRTGMVFLQSETHRVAAGPCVENDNQVINFINAQYMNHLQQQDWQICHAAGAVRGGRALGIAGFSGGGKSTLMLKALDGDGVKFLSNDRLFVRQEMGVALAAGIPKLPRINPGTALNNPRLAELVPSARRRELAAISRDALWEVEEKYDVDVAGVYGPDRIAGQAPLSAFLILNWSRNAEGPCKVSPVDITQRPDLLAAVMKSPGPFYQMSDGRMFTDGTAFDESAYLQAFAGVPFYEATGIIDFDVAADICLTDLLPG